MQLGKQELLAKFQPFFEDLSFLNPWNHLKLLHKNHIFHFSFFFAKKFARFLLLTVRFIHQMNILLLFHTHRYTLQREQVSFPFFLDEILYFQSWQLSRA